MNTNVSTIKYKKLHKYTDQYLATGMRSPSNEHQRVDAVSRASPAKCGDHSGYRNWTLGAKAGAGLLTEGGQQRSWPVPGNFPLIYGAWSSSYGISHLPACMSTSVLSHYVSSQLPSCTCSWTIEEVLCPFDKIQGVSEFLHYFCIKSKTLEGYWKKILVYPRLLSYSDTKSKPKDRSSY